MSRRTQIIVSASGLVLLLAVIAPLWSSRTPSISSLSYDVGGFRALYDTLERLGFSVRRSTQSPLSLQGANQHLVVLEPSAGTISDDSHHVSTLLSWIRRGNHLSLVASQTSGVVESLYGLRIEVPVVVDSNNRLIDQIMEEIDVDLSVDLGRWGDLRTYSVDHLHNARWLSEQTQVTCRMFSSLAGDDATEHAIALVDGKPVAARIPVGEGSVTVVAIADIFRNGRIQHDSNAHLAVHLLTDRGHPLLFDEFFHGLVKVGSIWQLALQAPQVWLSVSIVLCCLLFLWATAPRFGKPRDPPPASRRNKQEHMEAMGRMMAEAQPSAFVYERLRCGLLNEIRRRYALPASATEADTVSTVRRRSEDKAESLLAFLRASDQVMSRAAGRGRMVWGELFAQTRRELMDD